MREIKFRAKKIRDNKWIIGDLSHTKYSDGRVDISMWEQTPCAELNIKIDKETIGQYTGLKDMNNKDIYEGDIVEAWSEGIKATGEVRQRIDGYWIIYPAYQKSKSWTLSPNDNGDTSVKVIGNIYENPELLG